ncbi:MAG: amidohydrolase family protein [Acuticoccus sp.]
MTRILRNARLAQTPQERVDIVISEGTIVAVGGDANAEGEGEGEVIELGGRLVVPGLVETHIHLDKAHIADRCTIVRGDLAEAISEVARLKRGFTVADIAARATAALRKSIAHGTMRMRTHVEVDPVIGLKGLAGVAAAAAAHRWAIDVEICAFPQEGLFNNPGTDRLLLEALEAGATVLGGAPYVDTDPHGQIDWIFETARNHDVDIDLHLDFSLDATTLDVDHVCRRADDHGWGGRVAVGHMSKLASLDPERLAATAERLAASGVAVTVLPATDLFLMGREHDHAVPRGVAPVHCLARHGVTCSLSTNNMMNPFTPYGDGSLMRIANLYANVAQLGRADELADCLAMISATSARLMNLADYGIRVGAPADLLVLDARDPATAVAEIAAPLMGFKRGRQSLTRPAATLHDPA